MENILFISHKKAQCGVYEFGKDIFDVLKSSAKYNFVRAECASLEDLHVQYILYLIIFRQGMRHPVL